ncbi:MotA/TolQ/ExbB proton channel family protein [Tuwongella immobilis]|uniref:Membrane protein: Putative membrane protein n=1 Tax=Tuwongella immobilis TaxID=692036 RepID=A0A6C2YI31_9BACT|nr:MotA/TolQ/ExbB proton channel family protein [Tuwongella immobilis]VIP00652.1 membrane protein : Putative membrane protein OS=Rhodopirellula sallentina SM41 GN=RSSM_03223 PE=4 SV=1 [Tuwongella immobilis]VTR96722.1 membrane protein : Putative membrane protein OS=Rhodopirellula sallentina SM41 GN=RSSM_03223 PE=4 SV=1 [Tuwongella immobilis]
MTRFLKRRIFAMPNWVILLVLLGGLMANFELLAINSAMRKIGVQWIRSDLIWNEKGVPGLKSLLNSSGQLDPTRLGIRQDDLNSIDLLSKTAWAANDARTDDFLHNLFQTSDLDPFDRVATALGVPIQGMLRERSLRRLLFQDRDAPSQSATNPESLGRPTFPDDDQAREVLLRHFGNTYGEIMRWVPFRVMRWVNGWVQWLTTVAFVMAMMIVLRRWVEGVVFEERAARRFRSVAQASNQPEGLFPFVDSTQGVRLEAARESNEYCLFGNQIVAELERIHTPRPSHGHCLASEMLRVTYDGYLLGELKANNIRDRNQAAGALDQYVQHRLRRIDSEMGSLLYLAYAIPSLGFVGTVLGVGSALLSAGDMVTQNSELQREAIQTVSLSLGTAFDTTLVSLLLSLILMAWIYGVRQFQESCVLRFQHRILMDLIPRLRH